MSLFDKKDRFNILPTRAGKPIGGAGERQMLGTVFDPNSFEKRYRLNPDGTTTMLKTCGGMPQFITSQVVADTTLANLVLRMYTQIVSDQRHRGAQVTVAENGDVSVANSAATFPTYPVVKGDLVPNSLFKCVPYLGTLRTISSLTWFDGNNPKDNTVLSWGASYADTTRNWGHDLGWALTGLTQDTMEIAYVMPAGSWNYTWPGYYLPGQKTEYRYESGSGTFVPTSLRYGKNATIPYSLFSNALTQSIDGNFLSACRAKNDVNTAVYRTLEVSQMYPMSGDSYAIMGSLTGKEYEVETGNLTATTTFGWPYQVKRIRDYVVVPRWNSSGTEAVGVIAYEKLDNSFAVDVIKITWGVGITIVPFQASERLADYAAILAVDYAGDTLQTLWLEEAQDSTNSATTSGSSASSVATYTKTVRLVLNDAVIWEKTRTVSSSYSGSESVQTSGCTSDGSSSHIATLAHGSRPHFSISAVSADLRHGLVAFCVDDTESQPVEIKEWGGQSHTAAETLSDGTCGRVLSNSWSSYKRDNMSKVMGDTSLIIYLDGAVQQLAQITSTVQFAPTINSEYNDSGSNLDGAIPTESKGGGSVGLYPLPQGGKTTSAASRWSQWDNPNNQGSVTSPVVSLFLAADRYGKNAVVSAAFGHSIRVDADHTIDQCISAVNKILSKNGGAWLASDLQLPAVDTVTWMVEPLLVWENP